MTIALIVKCIMAEQASARVMTHPSLMWQNHTDLAINVPGQVLYEEITADSTSTSGFSFNFRSPADNALLDNCVIIEYPCFIYNSTAPNSDVWTTDLENLGGATAVNETRMDETLIAFRQCFAFARALQNLSVTINGSNFNVQPIYWLDALNRLYFSEEEASTICTSSGGEFDGPYPGPEPYFRLAGGSTNPGAGDNARFQPGGHMHQANAVASDIPIGNGYSFFNEGLEKRYQRFLDRLYSEGATFGNKAPYRDTNTADGRAGIVARADGAITKVTVVNNNDGVKVTVYERLPIAPFLFHNSKDARMSIPNIRQINITAQFATNVWNHVLQGEANGQLASAGFQDADNIKKISFMTEKCKLHTRWFLTNNSIPPVVRIRAPKYLQYLQQITYNRTGAGAHSGPEATQEFTFSNIQLDAIPDKFFIFAKRIQDEYTMAMPSEFYLSIASITLTIGGSSGRLTSLTPYQMYESFLRQSAHGGEKKLSFQDWYKFRCCAVLDAADIGLVAGPGYNYKTNMTVKLKLESYWDIQGIYNRRDCPLLQANSNFNIVVLCCYNQHYIELNSSGGSKSGLTMIPRM
jgi:hypothetical protein